AFARIWFADQDGAKRPVRRGALRQLPAKRRQLRHPLRDAVEGRFLIDKLDVFLREIQTGFHVGEKVEQVFAKSFQRSRYAAGQLRERQFQLVSVARRDHGLHGFSAGKVAFSREERPQGEFARLGGTRAG